MRNEVFDDPCGHTPDPAVLSRWAALVKRLFGLKGHQGKWHDGDAAKMLTGQVDKAAPEVWTEED